MENKQLKLIQISNTPEDKIYTIEPPGKTVMGLAYRVFSDMARDFPSSQKSVLRTFYLQEIAGNKRILKYEGNRTLTNQEKTYKYKFYVKYWGIQEKLK